MMIARNCLECKTIFKTEQKYVNRGHGKFCSPSCAAIYGNARRKLTGKTVFCSTCGDEIYRKNFRLNRGTKNFFCNRECKRKFETNDNQVRRRRGAKRKRHSDAKNALIEKFGVICQVPGCTLELHGDRSMVDIHHLADPENHEETMLMCPYHHRLAGCGHFRAARLAG